MAKTGRPKKPGNVTYLRLPKQIEQKLDEYVENYTGPGNISKSDVIRFALEQFFKAPNE